MVLVKPRKMKKKIVIKVQMNCEKCRTKARKVAAGAEGVDSVAIEGNDKEKVVVVGESVDPVRLVKLMRKKVGCTDLLSVEDVKAKPESKDSKPAVLPITYECRPICPPYPQYVACEPVYDQNPSLCTIM